MFPFNGNYMSTTLYLFTNMSVDMWEKHNMDSCTLLFTSRSFRGHYFSFGFNLLLTGSIARGLYGSFRVSSASRLNTSSLADLETAAGRRSSWLGSKYPLWVSTPRCLMSWLILSLTLKLNMPAAKVCSKPVSKIKRAGSRLITMLKEYKFAIRSGAGSAIYIAAGGV